MIINLKPKQILRRTFRRMGLEVEMITGNSYFQLLKAFDQFNINNVFDIGANTGQFASELRWFGYKGKIVSFEPLSEAHSVLTKTAASDSLWTIHQRAALGDYDGNTEINISYNSVSSSVLPMLDLHNSVAKDSRYVGTEKILMSRLDSVSSQYLSSSDNLFIKIDAQGYEWKVLGGSIDTLKRAKGVLCEQGYFILKIALSVSRPNLQSRSA